MLHALRALLFDAIAVLMVLLQLMVSAAVVKDTISLQELVISVD
jgi:hypothetical protein